MILSNGSTTEVQVDVLGFKLLPCSSLGIEKEIELCTPHFLLPPRGSKCPRPAVTETKPILQFQVLNALGFQIKEMYVTNRFAKT